MMFFRIPHNRVILVVWLTNVVTSMDKMSRIAVISERNYANAGIRG